MNKFIKGMDISTLIELEKCGAKYFDCGKEGDLFDILKAYGTNSVRIRLWNDPYDGQGMPYGAGTNDLETMVMLAKRPDSMEWVYYLIYITVISGQTRVSSLSQKPGKIWE